jgi:hypothetical protein
MSFEVKLNEQNTPYVNTQHSHTAKKAQYRKYIEIAAATGLAIGGALAINALINSKETFAPSFLDGSYLGGAIKCVGGAIKCVGLLAGAGYGAHVFSSGPAKNADGEIIGIVVGGYLGLKTTSYAVDLVSSLIFGN